MCNLTQYDTKLQRMICILLPNAKALRKYPTLIISPFRINDTSVMLYLLLILVYSKVSKVLIKFPEDPSCSNHDPNPWRFIWTLAIPEKVKFFYGEQLTIYCPQQKTYGKKKGFARTNVPKLSRSCRNGVPCLGRVQ